MKLYESTIRYNYTKMPRSAENGNHQVDDASARTTNENSTMDTLQQTKQNLTVVSKRLIHSKIDYLLRCNGEYLLAHIISHDIREIQKQASETKSITNFETTSDLHSTEYLCHEQLMLNCNEYMEMLIKKNLRENRERSCLYDLTESMDEYLRRFLATRRTDPPLRRIQVPRPKETGGLLRVPENLEPKFDDIVGSSIPEDGTFSYFYCFGMKVTVIDRDMRIIVVDMVPSHLCDAIRYYTERHVERLESHGRLDLAWRTLYTYTKMDLPCCEVPGLGPIVWTVIAHVKRLIGYVLDRPRAESFLRPRSWKEPHLLKYQKLPSKQDHVGVCSHFDGSDFTWQLMLSTFDEYQGGGTYFRCLKKTLRLRKGQVLIHPGELYHIGVDITQGTRQLAVCFMDGCPSGVKDSSSETDDSPSYQRNVVNL